MNNGGTGPQKKNGNEESENSRDNVLINPIEAASQEKPTAPEAQNARGQIQPIPIKFSFGQRLRRRFKLWREQHKLSKGRCEKAKWTDVGTLILTAIVAASAIYSAWIFQGQLEIARKQSDDAAHDARSSRRNTRRQLAIAQEQAYAAQESAKAIQRQTAQEERPWIAADLSIARPLIFDERGASINVKINLRNVGHSVAKYVGVWTALKPVTSLDQSELKRFCERIYPKTTGNTSDYGHLLFPGQFADETQPAFAPPKDIDQGMFKEGAIRGKVALYYLACIDYVTTFDATHHQTGLVRMMGYPDPVTHLTISAFDPHGVYNQVIRFPTGHGDFAD